MGAWVAYFAIAFVIIVNFLVYGLNENSLPWRSLARGRRGWLFISNRRAGQDGWPSCFLAWDLVDPCHPVTSPVVPQSLLLALRLLALLYFTVYFIVKAKVDNDLAPNWLLYFTNWSFCLFALSMGLGAACVASGMHRQRQQRQRQHAADGIGNGIAKQRGSGPLAGTAHSPSQSLTEALCAQCGSKIHRGFTAVCGRCASWKVPGWTLLGKTHLAAVAVAFPAEVFLTLFYWIFIFKNDAEDATQGLATNIMVHGTNNVFALADVLLSRMPFVSYHFQLLLLYGSLYLVFMWIYYGASGTWVYDALNWHKGRSVAVYLLLPLVLAACFFFYWGLARLRERLGTRQRAAETRAEAAEPAPEPTGVQLALV